MKAFRICSILALGVAALHTNLSAENPHSPTGVWNVAVTVVNCSTGAPIRNVRSLQMYVGDGSFSETTFTASRGPSVGTWDHESDRSYSAAYWFFRYNPDGSFASFAQALNAVEISEDGNHFTAAGTIHDYNAAGTLLSSGCVTQAATRLNAPHH